MHFALAALTVLTLLLNGYHPLAEDGGLYVAGIQYTLNPTLFPHYTAFVTEHLHFSLFAPTLAALVRLTHISLPYILLITNLFSIWLTFYAAHKLLQRTIANNLAQLTALCLLAVFWTLPIAGTSLLLMDPYVTARSLSTPLSLLAIAFALDDRKRALFASILCILLAAAFHPLMAAYAFALILILRLPQRRSIWIILTLAALTLAAAINHFAPPETPAIIAAEISRYYWFLTAWHWYELLGLAAPLAVLALLLRYFNRQFNSLARNAATLCRASILCGCIAILITSLFAHEFSAVNLVARLQPLRVFLMIYAIMTLLLAATLTQRLLGARARTDSLFIRRILTTTPILTLLALAATMFTVQRNTFPNSHHIELPSQPPRNPWSQAFLWARNNTPPDALFALDAKYVNEPGEDAQTFRATALRSALPDFSKDGGEAAITPSLAAQWQPAAAAQANLSIQPDAIRDAHLQPFNVTWIILHANSPTAHPCPYNNGTVKVCRHTP